MLIKYNLNTAFSLGWTELTHCLQTFHCLTFSTYRMWHSIYFILLHFSTGLLILPMYLWWIENEAGLCHIQSRKKWSSLVVKVIGCYLGGVASISANVIKSLWEAAWKSPHKFLKVAANIFFIIFQEFHTGNWNLISVKSAEVNKTHRCGAALRIQGLGWLALYIEYQRWRKKALKCLSSGSLRFMADLLFHLAQGSSSQTQTALEQVSLPWLCEGWNLGELEGSDPNLAALFTQDAAVTAMPKVNTLALLAAVWMETSIFQPHFPSAQWYSYKNNSQFTWIWWLHQEQ